MAGVLKFRHHKTQVSPLNHSSLAYIVLASCLLFTVGCNSPAGQTEANSGEEIGNASAQLVAQQNLLLSRWALMPYDASRDDFVRSESFDNYFEPVGLLALSDSILFRSIQSVDIDREGNLLLTEIYTDVYLYDAGGELVSVLDPEPCHPGYNHTPLKARFDHSGQIVVASNTIPSGMIYDNRGNCIATRDLHSLSPSDVVPGPAEELFVYNTYPDSVVVYGVTVLGEKRILLAVNEFSELNDRIKGTTQLVAAGNLFLVLSQRQNPAATLIDLSTGDISKIGVKPDYFRPITRDIPSGSLSTEELFREFRIIGDGKSTTSGLVALSDEFIVIRHRNSYETFASSPRGVAWQIVHVSGYVVNEEPIFMLGYQTSFPGSRDGLLLRMGVTYRSEGPFDSNPPILVYRFRPSGP